MTGAQVPANRHALAALLAGASAAGTRVRIAGGGSSSRRGLPVDAPPVAVATAGLDRLVAHEPADLTVTVEGGVPASRLAEALGARGQMWAQADDRPGATVGGLLATAASGRRRLRVGAIRDAVLQVVLCTGDGRLVTAGGRTVKGVAGYDLPRLAVGSLGTLGVIVEVTLKLAPVPPASGWFAATGTTGEMAALAERLRRELHRPACLLVSPGRLDVELVGPEADVVAPPGTEPGRAPARPSWEGTVEAGVPVTAVASLCAELAALDLPFEAQAGVGTCRIGVRTAEEVGAARAVALRLGGHAVVADGPPDLREDPWGPPPPGLVVMERMRRAFDPAGILNPGLFVGEAVRAGRV